MAPSDAHGAAYDRARVGVLVLLAASVVLTFRDYGVTLDEGFHLSYGFYIIRFFGSGFTNHTALTYRIDYLYGGGFDASGMIFRAWTRAFLQPYDAIHLYGALLGVLGVAGTGRLTRLLAGPRAALLSVVMLATTSVYYGHMFNNPKDLPFAVGYVWGLYYLFRVFDAFPRLPRRLVLQAAFALGMAMSVRIGGLLLLCYLGLLAFVFVAYYGWMTRDAEATYQTAKRTVQQSLLVAGGAWFVMVAWWPWAMLDPIRRPLAALTRMSQFIDHRRYMPFAGEQVYNLDPPWDYLLHYFALKLPEYVVVVFVAAVFVGLGALVSGAYRSLGFRRGVQLGVLAFAIVFPPVYAVYKGSPLYDGLRHFLFLVPPIIVVVAMVIDRLILEASRRWGAVGWVPAAAIVAALIGDQAATVARYHPHQYVYFNRFIGGLAGAHGQYSTDYYAGSYKAAVRQLPQRLWDTEREQYLEGVYRIGGCVGEFRGLRNLPGNFIYKKPGDAPYDFDISFTRGDCHLKEAEHPELYRVEVDGGPLTIVRDMRLVSVPREQQQRLRRLEQAEQRRTEARKKANKKRPKPQARKKPPKKPGDSQRD